MLKVDRLAVEKYGLDILQMMENAGRNLAVMAMEMLPSSSSSITILAGSGGNGGGGICCARHLLNRGYTVNLFLSREIPKLSPAAKKQLHIITAAGFQVSAFEQLTTSCAAAELIIDALIGYSLSGEPTGKPREMIQAANLSPAPKLSLDIPSGIDATSATTNGEYIQATRTLTLALPKKGLGHPAVGKLFLADIGISPRLYQGLDIQLNNIFSEGFIIPLNVN